MGLLKITCSSPLCPSIQQSCDRGLSMQSLVLTVRCWYVHDRSWIIGSMSAESATVGIWNTCKVCTETLRDTLSSDTNLSSISAMVTDLQTHETPERLLTCPVYDHISPPNIVQNQNIVIENLSFGNVEKFK